MTDPRTVEPPTEPSDLDNWLCWLLEHDRDRPLACRWSFRGTARDLRTVDGHGPACPVYLKMVGLHECGVVSE